MDIVTLQLILKAGKLSLDAIKKEAMAKKVLPKPPAPITRIARNDLAIPFYCHTVDKIQLSVDFGADSRG